MIGRWEQRLAWAGSVWGLAVMALGAYVVSWADEPHGDWSIAIFGFGMAPFILVLFASRFAANDAAVRAPLLLAATVMTLPVTGGGYLLPFPALLTIAAATLLAWRSGMRTSGLPLRGAVAAAAFVASWAAGFALLFAFEDERCTTFATGVTCSSDIVTATEALGALGVLAAGAVAVALALRNASRSPARAGV